ncbi:protein PET100 homolog, mitochondrial [Sardina pilchardus]|uniref:protein PET100 homolog, mitochondrial n=1 Tax=Sardina pilchardus TaxID=27697 RepID=UPI002E1382A4
MGVKIEIFRMMLYMSFPVAMFWVSNQAEYFEEYIVKRKREIFPPDEKMQRQELEEFKERMRARKEQRILKKMGLESQDSRTDNEI